MLTYTFSLNGATLYGFSGLGQVITNDIQVSGTIIINNVNSNTATSVIIDSLNSSSQSTNPLFVSYQSFIGVNFITARNNFYMQSGNPVISFEGGCQPVGHDAPSLLTINSPVNGFVFGFDLKNTSQESSYIALQSNVTFTGPGLNIPCFAEGTRLLTQNGYKAIETLTGEDRLLTTQNRSISFHLTQTHIPCTTKATAPYLLATGSLGENIPSVPLYMSPAHKFAVRDNIWVHASKGHTLGLDIKQCPVGKAVTYYHVRCDNYARDVILAEGVATESLANKTEDSITFKKTDKVGVFLRNEYKAPTKSLKA